MVVVEIIIRPCKNATSLVYVNVQKRYVLILYATAYSEHSTLHPMNLDLFLATLNSTSVKNSAML